MEKGIRLRWNILLRGHDQLMFGAEVEVNALNTPCLYIILGHESQLEQSPDI